MDLPSWKTSHSCQTSVYPRTDRDRNNSIVSADSFFKWPLILGDDVPVTCRNRSASQKTFNFPFSCPLQGFLPFIRQLGHSTKCTQTGRSATYQRYVVQVPKGRRFKWILMSSKRKSGIVDGPDSFLSFVQLLSEVRYIHAKLRRPYGEAVLSITFKTRFRVGLRSRIIKQFHCLTCLADTKPTIGRSWANAHAIFPNLCCLLVVKPSPPLLFLLLPSAINL